MNPVLSVVLLLYSFLTVTNAIHLLNDHSSMPDFTQLQQMDDLLTNTNDDPRNGASYDKPKQPSSYKRKMPHSASARRDSYVKITGASVVEPKEQEEEEQQ